MKRFRVRALVVLGLLALLVPSVIGALNNQALRGPVDPAVSLASGAMCLACPVVLWLAGEAIWAVVRRARASAK